MDTKDPAKDKHKTMNKESSAKELHPGILGTVRISKSDEAVTNTASVSKNNSIKSEKDVRFAITPILTVEPEKSFEKETKSSNKENKHLDKGLEKDSKSNKENKQSKSVDLSKDGIDRQDSRLSVGSPKVPRKYFTNWRQACDKTKDRTKELLKRWRTLPESDGPMEDLDLEIELHEDKEATKGHGWSVHVWTTWVNRYSIDGGDGGDSGDEEQPPESLSQLQSDKMRLFFTELLDLDHDDLVSEQDFEHFCEKLAHFADWSTNSPEFNILLEVKLEFTENFINPLPAQYKEKSYWRRLASGLPLGTVDCELWLARWPLLLPSCGRFHRLPLFLQYFCKILFGVMNQSGSGKISRQELRAFYMSVVGMTALRCDEIMDTAYNLLTSNDRLPLNFETYKRCYCNWLCGKNPNGPGQWAVVPPRGPLSREPFPVDYSALNTDPAHLEKYTPNNKTNRHSVIV